jgi:hypothetical protein
VAAGKARRRLRSASYDLKGDDMTEKPLAVRTHHLMCMSRGAATGSNHPTLSPLLEWIRRDPGRLIRVVVGPDVDQFDPSAAFCFVVSGLSVTTS